jgi:hypothetical protein
VRERQPGRVSPQREKRAYADSQESDEAQKQQNLARTKESSSTSSRPRIAHTAPVDSLSLSRSRGAARRAHIGHRVRDPESTLPGELQPMRLPSHLPSRCAFITVSAQLVAGVNLVRFDSRQLLHHVLRVRVDERVRRRKHPQGPCSSRRKRRLPAACAWSSAVFRMMQCLVVRSHVGCVPLHRARSVLAFRVHLVLVPRARPTCSRRMLTSHGLMRSCLSPHARAVRVTCPVRYHTCGCNMLKIMYYV